MKKQINSVKSLKKLSLNKKTLVELTSTETIAINGGLGNNNDSEAISCDGGSGMRLCDTM